MLSFILDLYSAGHNKLFLFSPHLISLLVYLNYVFAALNLPLTNKTVHNAIHYNILVSRNMLRLGNTPGIRYLC